MLLTLTNNALVCLMKLVPFDRFVLCTKHAPHELGSLLAPSVGKPKIRINFWPSGKPLPTRFEGRIGEDGFKVWPLVPYGNGFLPIIIGRWEPSVEGSNIRVTQRMHWFANLFMLAWFGFLIVFLGAVLTSQSESQVDFLSIVFFVLVLIGLGWAMMTVAFWLEARHTRGNLGGLFNATVEDASSRQ